MIKKAATYFLSASGVVLYILIGVGMYKSEPQHRIIKFDCSADEMMYYPQEVKIECRKLMNVTRV